MAVAKAAGNSIRAKRSARNADLAAERAKVSENERAPEAAEDGPAAPGAAETWLALQKGNPSFNPWLSPTFLVETWSLASDLEVPLLPALPEPARVRKLREACGLTVEAVAERAAVTPEMWSAYEYGNTTVLGHVNVNQLLKFCSVMAVCVAAGGPPVPAPTPVPEERRPMTLVAAELLAEVAREAGDRLGVAHAVIDDWTSTRIARGEIPSPTLTDWPSEKEAARLVSAFPALANRRRSVAWTHTGPLADLLERDDLTDQPFQPRDELGVGKAGMLRVLGTMAAIIAADPDRVATVEAEKQAREQRQQDEQAAAVKARAAVAQASLLLAQAEDEAAQAALAEAS